MVNSGYIYLLGVSTVLLMIVNIMELSFIHANRLKLEAARKKSSTLNYITGILTRNAEIYFSGLFIFKTFSIIGITLSIAAIAIPDSAPATVGRYLLVLMIIMALIIIAGYLSKAMLRLNPNKFLQWLSVPSFIIYVISFPFAKPASVLPLMAYRKSRPDIQPYDNAGDFEKGDFSDILEKVSGNEHKKDNDKNIRLFRNALNFHEVLVRDCMVPRVDIEAVEKGTTIEELVRRFNETKYSRLPVYDTNIDHIIGYVTGKLLYRRPASISEIMTPVDYVPETMTAQCLLGNFIKKHHSIAIVIDEFGGTAGMVTLEDILEEIFGEIKDEHDQQDYVEKKIGNNEYIFSGRVEIARINKKYHLGIPESDEYDTLAGYVIYVNKDIPVVGDVIPDGNKKMKIMRADSSRIELIRLTLTSAG